MRREGPQRDQALPHWGRAVDTGRRPQSPHVCPLAFESLQLQAEPSTAPCQKPGASRWLPATRNPAAIPRNPTWNSPEIPRPSLQSSCCCTKVQPPVVLKYDHRHPAPVAQAVPCGGEGSGVAIPATSNDSTVTRPHRPDASSPKLSTTHT